MEQVVTHQEITKVAVTTVELQQVVESLEMDIPAVDMKHTKAQVLNMLFDNFSLIACS